MPLYPSGWTVRTGSREKAGLSSDLEGGGGGGGGGGNCGNYGNQECHDPVENGPGLPRPVGHRG